MNDVRITRHAETRIRQRGYRERDIQFFLAIATEVKKGEFLCTDKDCAREIEKRKVEIRQLEHLRGTKVIMNGDDVITIYHVPGSRGRSQMKGERGLR